MDFKNSIILLTGASSGIGYQLAKDLALEGAKLALLSRRLDLLEKLSSEIDKKTFIRTYKCDVTIKDNVIETITQIKKDFGKIDIVILNSGVGHESSVLNYSSNAAENIFKTNVLGAVYCIEQVLPEFISDKRGVIVGISSLADSKGFSKSGFYTASKAALTVLLESLRIELKKYNVKVITVKPGFVKTAMTDKNNFNMPFLMTVEKASNIILKGIQKEKKIIEFPLVTSLAAKFLKFLPICLFDYLASKELKNNKK